MQSWSRYRSHHMTLQKHDFYILYTENQQIMVLNQASAFLVPRSCLLLQKSHNFTIQKGNNLVTDYFLTEETMSETAG